MEAAPRAKTNESVESADRWRELKEQAPEEAKRLMSDAFEGREGVEILATERVEILDRLIESHVSDNDNRFLVESWALMREMEEAGFDSLITPREEYEDVKREKVAAIARKLSFDASIPHFVHSSENQDINRAA